MVVAVELVALAPPLEVVVVTLLDAVVLLPPAPLAAPVVVERPVPVVEEVASLP